MGFKEDYVKDLQSQTRSGPHHIDAERQALNERVFNAVQDILPFADIHKSSDCDLIYRFLIAKKWDVDLTIQGLREYIAFRKTLRLDEIIWESVPDDMRTVLACDYSGFDQEGHPIFFDKPDPKGLSILLTKFSREELMRAHYRQMELGRRLCKMYRTDRVTCILDLSLLNMSLITNPSAVGLLKHMAHQDQTMYPENMRFMLICNGGWTFSSLYKILKPLLDPRVQQKINFMSSGASMLTDMEKFVRRDSIPNFLGGGSSGTPLLSDADIKRLPIGTAPIELQDIDTAATTELLFGSPRMQDRALMPVPEDIDPEDL